MPQTIKHQGTNRNSTTCVACGNDKGIGLALCWGCFKYPRTDGKEPYKYWDNPAGVKEDEDEQIADYCQYLKS